jgi:hypothetical protein
MHLWNAAEIEKMRVDDLIPYDRNPKIHPDTQIRQLANSIREWGWTMPILIDENDQIIAGHGRLFAAKELKMEEVPCIRTKGWSEQQKKAYVIADNKLAENGELDTGLYFSHLKEMSNDGFDLSLMGVDIDMSAFNYNPIYEPTFDASEIDESKMIKASDKMNGDMSDRIKGQEGTEVMCPHCAETFVFTGR